MTISEAKRRIDVCVAGFQAKSDEIVDGMTPEMEDKQREQMWAGETALGNRINPPYTLYTTMIKAKKGQPTDRVTLRDTGAFYAGIFVKREGDELVFGSKDAKTVELTEKYGEAIFGLKQEAYVPLSEEWRNRMLEWIKQMIFN